jgi:uncharacterized protein with gpF-like domain
MRRPAKVSGKVLPGVRPNAGIAASYRKKLDALIAEMAGSYAYWLKAQYRANPPEMALDAVSSADLAKLLRRLGRHWSKRFNAMAPKLAAYFAQSVHRQSMRDLKRITKEAGFSVPMPPMTPELRDIMKAEVAENVSLIRSIQQQYHTEVEGMVMRSVTAGRDLKTLADELQDRYDITRKRAAFIALNQNNQTTSAIQRERQTAVGITRAVWMHSHAGKVPRKTHLANDRNEFDLKTGWFDPDEHVRKRIWPGQLINCRCSWRPLVRGFS